MSGAMGHTPGPWIVSHPFAWKAEIRNADRFIGHVSRADGSDAEMRANAQLVASAPDLLAACRAADGLFADLVAAAESKSQADAMRHCQAFVRAAILKAEGGQS